MSDNSDAVSNRDCLGAIYGAGEGLRRQRLDRRA